MKNSFLKLSAVLTILLMLGSCNEDEPIEPEETNAAPTAIISVDKTDGDVPLTVSLDASSSSDPDGDMLSYFWDLGDGSVSGESSLSHTYSAAGIYQITLTVIDDGGLEDTDQVSINAEEPINLFPITENAQWVYRVISQKAENGQVTAYEEGLVYLNVISNERVGEIDYVEMRVTGRRNYDGISFNERIFLEHKAGQTLKVKHKPEDNYRTMINLNSSSWSGYAMFFSNSSSKTVTMSTSSANVEAGNFQGLMVKHADDNWGEQYVTERYDVLEQELHNPEVGLVQRQTSRYVNFLDCFTCPVYTGSSTVELIGYYIPQEDGSVVEGGSGINPNNPYGGDQGLLTVWTSYDLGYISVYLDGEYAGLISNYWPSGLSCDQTGALNISRPDGSYQFRAESSQYVWTGTVTFREGVCDDVQLVL